MTIAQFLRDLDAVVELVRQRFDKDKVVLLGHSWGTALGTLYTFQHPEKVAAYVGTGQVADMRAGERLSYDFALAEATRRGHAAALAALHTIGPPPHSVDAMLTSRKCMERFGGAFHGNLSTGKLIWAALMTDEASLVDLMKFGQGNRFSLEHLWREFSQLDLTPYRSFDVPLFFLLGRYDWQVPALLAGQYFATIDAPCKRLVWFEHSAHHPPFEEPEKFQAVLIGQVLPLVQAHARACSDAPSLQHRNGMVEIPLTAAEKTHTVQRNGDTVWLLDRLGHLDGFFCHDHTLGECPHGS
jgi:pimeloyl-ACP methyl ester carboxylesterase